MIGGLALLALTVPVYVLAVMRLTRLINADAILDRIRIAIAHRARGEDRSAAERRRWLAVEYFANCPWCVSIWVALGTSWVPLYHAGNPVAQYVGVSLAVSMLVGLFAPLSSDEDVEIVGA